VEAFHFKKAGLVDSESFRLYFQAIRLIEENPQLRQQIWYRGRLKIFESETKLVMPFSFFCFPGIISPYEINGEPYSDGGILNHFLRIYYKVNVTILSVFMSVLFKKIEAKDLN
jgi:NTE family protein